MKHFVSTFVLLAALSACGRDTENDPQASRNPETVEVVLRSDVAWLNSGVELRPGERYRIEPLASQLTQALGLEIADFNAPVPTAGSTGLIARIGRNGLPTAVGRGLELQSSSLTIGEYLFIGRNGIPNAPGGTTADTDRTTITDLKVRIHIERTNAPAPLSPANGFWTTSVAPTFDWDDADGAFKYVFELSRFPDFREHTLNLESPASSLSLTTLPGNVDFIPLPGQEESIRLNEGTYFWRVRGQVNECRTIAPCFKWTDHSTVFRVGVETYSALPQPTILRPNANARFQRGQPVIVEFTQALDASGMFWRHKHYHAACGAVISPASSAPESTSPWKVFLASYETNFIGQVPQDYASLQMNNLGAGSHLIRVEVVDAANGPNPDTSRAGIADIAFTVGCQN